MEVVLWDYSIGTSGYTKTPWTITVTNTAPNFNVPILPNATVQLNVVSLYSVATMIKDDEGHNSILTYAKYTSTGSLTTIIPFVSL